MVEQQETEAQSSDSRPKEAISVVIATHNQADALRSNLPRILEQEYERFEVIVVNNASTDDTEDVLKTLELKYANLHHTFTPSGARHISHKRLSLTIGIKAAQYEWLLLTEPDSRPCSPHWLSIMAGHFHDGIQIVLGYANYMPDKRLLSRKTIFFNLFHQMQYLPWATRHKAYRCNPANIAYRKSLFMAHKGFADDINLIGGVTELLVNRHSCVGNTAVSLHPDSKVECEDMTSGKPAYLYSIVPRPCPSDGAYGSINGRPRPSYPYCLSSSAYGKPYGSTVRHVRWENAPTTCLSFGTKCVCSDGTPVRGWTTGPLHAHGSTARLSETERKNRLHISLINRNFAA